MNMRSTNGFCRYLLPMVGALLMIGSHWLPGAEPRTRVVFYAMGDVPYEPAEDTLLPRQISELPRDAEFVVHVGDIKSGSTPCDEAVYNKVFGMLTQSKPTVFIIPGDNEWNDCADPDNAWTLWKKHFTRFDQRWKHRFAVLRQISRRENFSFVRNGVLFIGLNLVGGRLHDPDEWEKRHDDNLEWVKRNLRYYESKASCLLMNSTSSAWSIVIEVAIGAARWSKTTLSARCWEPTSRGCRA